MRGDLQQKMATPPGTPERSDGAEFSASSPEEESPMIPDIGGGAEEGSHELARRNSH